MVSVCMITYNQEKFIHKAITNIIQQKTNFDFELVIGEDFSTDNTKNICQEYSEKFPKQIKLLSSEKNLGITTNFIRTIFACNKKYIAFCEGDDYWLDPYKLQKQVDILEADSKYGLIHSKFIYYNEKGEKSDPFSLGQTDMQGAVFEKLLIQNRIGTLTVVVRKKLLIDAINYYQLIGERFPCYDIFLWLYCSLTSKIAFLDEVTAVYRSIKGSASFPFNPVNKAKFLVDISKIELFYSTNFLTSQKIKKALKIKACKRSFFLNFLIKKRKGLLNNLFNLLVLQSVSLKDLVYVFGSFIPFGHRLLMKRIEKIY